MRKYVGKKIHMHRNFTVFVPKIEFIG